MPHWGPVQPRCPSAGHGCSHWQVSPTSLPCPLQSSLAKTGAIAASSANAATSTASDRMPAVLVSWDAASGPGGAVLPVRLQLQCTRSKSCRSTLQPAGCKCSMQATRPDQGGVTAEAGGGWRRRRQTPMSALACSHPPRCPARIIAAGGSAFIMHQVSHPMPSRVPPAAPLTTCYWQARLVLAHLRSACAAAPCGLAVESIYICGLMSTSPSNPSPPKSFVTLNLYCAHPASLPCPDPVWPGTSLTQAPALLDSCSFPACALPCPVTPACER